MSAPRRIRPYWPRPRWYLGLLRLNLARLWAMSGRARAVRLGWTFVAIVAAIALVQEQLAPPVEALLPDGSPVVVKAYINWVVQLAILAASALLTYLLTPKPKAPEKVESKAPVSEQGKGVVRIYGPVWIDDSTMLGWKDMGTKKIRAKGGKKG